MRSLEDSCVPLGADGQCCHGRMHRSPCSLAPRVLERCTQCCDSPGPISGKCKGGMDQDDCLAGAVCALGMSQQSTSAARCWHLFLPGLQWWLDSSLAGAKRSPAHSVPDVPRVGCVEDARASERCGRLVRIAKPVPRDRG